MRFVSMTNSQVSSGFLKTTISFSGRQGPPAGSHSNLKEEYGGAADTGSKEYRTGIRRFRRIDWADKKHYWSLSVGGLGRPERGTLDNTPEAVEVWMMELRRRFEGQPIAPALEQRRGALVVMLGKYDHACLYPVHPRTLARFREAWYPSGAKDDTKDAELLREIVFSNAR
jgi:hypothetical protein